MSARAPAAAARKFVADVAAEVRRVVGVHRHADAGPKQVGEGRLGHGLEHPELGVRQRADRQRDCLSGQSRHECWVVCGSHAVVDAGHAENVERARDKLGAALLTCVSDRSKAESAGAGEDTGELLGRIAKLGRVKPDGDDSRKPRRRCRKGLLGGPL